MDPFPFPFLVESGLGVYSRYWFFVNKPKSQDIDKFRTLIIPSFASNNFKLDEEALNPEILMSKLKYLLICERVSFLGDIQNFYCRLFTTGMPYNFLLR